MAGNPIKIGLLQIEVAGFSKQLVSTYEITQWYNPEDQNLNLQYSENFESNVARLQTKAMEFSV
jgi:hypothetical protein